MLKYLSRAGVGHWLMIAPKNLHELDNHMPKFSIVWLAIVVVCSEDAGVVEGAEVTQDDVVVCHAFPLGAMCVHGLDQSRAR